MTSLESKISEINLAISTGLESVHVEGIVSEVKKDGKTINVNQDGEAVLFDDASEVYLYHKLLGEVSQKLKSGGKTNLYNIRANMVLFAYAKDKNIKDYILSKLSNIKWVEILTIPNDPYKYLKEETGLEEFDFSKNIIVVNYQALYKSDKCYELTCVS